MGFTEHLVHFIHATPFHSLLIKINRNGQEKTMIKYNKLWFLGKRLLSFLVSLVINFFRTEEFPSPLDPLREYLIR